MVDRRTYGGRLYDYDFQMRYESLKNVAERIAGDERFDERCKRAIEQRDRLKSGYYLKNKQSNG